MAVCRFCGAHAHDDSRLLKYGVRHYAHHDCYLAAGRRLEDLPDWQVARFPWRVVLEFGLESVVEAACDREKIKCRQWRDRLTAAEREERIHRRLVLNEVVT